MHISIAHGIRDLGEFGSQVEERSRADGKADEYHRYVIDLQKLREADLISPEEFRRRSANWKASQDMEA